MDIKNKKTTALISLKNTLKTLKPFKNKLLLVSDDGFFLNGYDINKNAVTTIQLDTKINSGQIENTVISNNKIWLLERENIKQCELKTDSILVVKSYNIRRVNNLIETKSHIYFTSVDGFFKIQKSTNKIIPFSQLNNIYCSGLTLLNDSTFLISTYGDGVWKTNKTNNSIRKLNIDESLLIKDIKYYENLNWIALNTMNGIYIYNGSSFSFIKHLSNKSGLINNSVSDFLITDSSIVILSKNGITISTHNTTTKIPTIKLNRIVNGNNVNLLNEYLYKNNSLVFRVETNSLTYLNKVIIKYKLEGYSEEWIETNSPILKFNNLPAQKFKLIVSVYTPDASLKSNTIKYSFEIKAPFWKTKIFYIFCTALFLLVSFLMYRYFLLRSLKTEKIKKLTHQLNLQSIQSQINPHFFSNVLTGIQNLILKNDLETANEYIYNLGNLSRDIIASSKDEIWPLNKEIILMTNYLSFEKIRFKNRFEYSINVNENININETYIPTMIIQPLVENAIKHAFIDSNKKGLLEINFLIHLNTLIIEVKDNGNGFNENNKQDGYGLKIIKGKLKLIENIYKKKVSFCIETEKEKGTSFIIKIPKNLKK